MATRRKKTQPADGLTTNRQAGAPVKVFVSSPKPAAKKAPAAADETAGDVTQAPAPMAAPAPAAAEPSPRTQPSPNELDLMDVLRMRPHTMKTSPTSVRISSALKERVSEQIDIFSTKFPDTRKPSQSDVINAALSCYVSLLESASPDEYARLWAYLGLRE